MLVPLYKGADKGWIQERLNLERSFQLQQVIEMEKEQKEEVGFAWAVILCANLHKNQTLCRPFLQIFVHNLLNKK